jgi:hypothetical protein
MFDLKPLEGGFPVIELKKYTIHEMSAILNSKGKQAIERKLKRYDIEFITSGRGDDVVFEITAIQNKFKVFCITEFNMPAQCGFERYLHFTYYFLNVDDFRWLPNETLSLMMGEAGRYVSRQWIGRWKQRLEALDVISAASEFTYYFAQGQTQILTDSNTYKKAWREYFQDRENGASWQYAIEKMKHNYGGVGRKQPISELSAFHTQFYEIVNECFHSQIASDT